MHSLDVQMHGPRFTAKATHEFGSVFIEKANHTTHVLELLERMFATVSYSACLVMS